MFAAFVALFIVAVAPWAAQAAHQVTTSARDDAVTHIGQWYIFPESVTNCGGQLVQYCNTTGCGLSFSFTGTAVDLTVTKDTDRGTIAVEFDGQSQGTVNAWTPTDGEATCESLFSRNNLANQQHTLKVTVAEPHDNSAKFEVISFTVTVPDAGDNTGGGGGGGGGQQTTTQPPNTTGNGGGGGGGGQQPASSTNQPTSNPPSQSQPSSTGGRSSTGGGASPSQTPSSTNTAINAETTAEVNVADPRLQYSPAGAWADSGTDPSVSACSTGTKIATTPGAAFSFSFKGTAISFRTVSSDVSGLYTVALDGVTTETKNGFAPTSGLCSPVLAWSKSGLTEGDHVLVVTVAGASNGTLAKRAGSRLELAGLTYYGRETLSTDAYNAANNPPANNQGAIIGGSVGGVLVAFLIAGVGTFLFLRHRKSQREKSRMVPAAAGFPPGPSSTSGLDPRFASPGPGVPMAWGGAQSPQHSAMGISPNRSFSAHHPNGSGVLAFQPAGGYAPVPTGSPDPGAYGGYGHHSPSPQMGAMTMANVGGGHPYAGALSPGVVEAMYQPAPISQQSAPSSVGPRSPTSASGRSVPSVPIAGSGEDGHVEPPWAGGVAVAPRNEKTGLPTAPAVPPMSPPPAYGGGRTPAPPARQGYAQEGTVLL